LLFLSDFSSWFPYYLYGAVATAITTTLQHHQDKETTTIKLIEKAKKQQKTKGVCKNNIDKSALEQNDRQQQTGDRLL
jgi:hypothetical protein